jgi:transcriptional regulator with XRE-family HTH domain
MTLETGSTVPKRQVGRLLRQLREQAGISLMAAATELEFSRARMYRIENGEVAVRKHDVIAMCGIYAAPDDITTVLIGLAAESKTPGWWHPYAAVVPEWFELYVGMEQAASQLRHYAQNVIPGPLQIKEYAEQIFRSNRRLDEASIDNAISVRLERQRFLHRKGPRATKLQAGDDRETCPEISGRRSCTAEPVTLIDGWSGWAHDPAHRRPWCRRSLVSANRPCRCRCSVRRPVQPGCRAD